MWNHRLVASWIATYATFQLATAWKSWKPMVKPENDTIFLAEGDRLEIACFGEGRELDFQYPENGERGQGSEPITTSPNLPNEPYRLVIENVTTRAIGWYDCAEKDVRLPRNPNAIVHEHENVSSIFVYVSSSKETFVDVSIGFVEIKQGHRLVVPCLKTSPEVNVTCEKSPTSDNEVEVFRYVEKFGCVFEGFELGSEYEIACVAGDGTNHKSTIEVVQDSQCPEPKLAFAPNKNNLGGPKGEFKVEAGTNIEINCTAEMVENLPLEITWTYPLSIRKNQLNVTAASLTEDPGTFKSTLSVKNVTKENEGKYTCFARELDYEPTTNKSVDIRIVPFINTSLELVTNEGVDEWSIDPGENLTVVINVRNTTEEIDLRWFKPDGSEILEGEIYQKKKKISDHQYELKIYDCQLEDSGTYEIFGNDSEHETTLKITVIIEEKPSLPKISVNEVEFKSGEELRASCESRMDRGNVTWYFTPIKMNKTTELVNSTSTVIENREGMNFTWTSSLRTTVNESGQLMCVFGNNFGRTSGQHPIQIQVVVTATHTVLLSLVGVLIVAVIISSTYLCVRIRRDKAFKSMLQEAGMAHFEDGALECLNPELTIGDQAELLPYDEKWEFPRVKLKLGKQLGSGAFGVVMKAEARGICESEESTTVAVKMVRVTTEPMYIKALASELKIMVHLGKHLNVVNLLGACTKDIGKRELYVIVEYCRYGNLHNYLHRHRSNFVDQLDPEMEIIDTSVGFERFEKRASVRTINGMKYLALSFNHSTSETSSGCESAGSDSTDYYNITGSTNVNGSPDNSVYSNDSIQPGWRSNYTGDYKDTNLRPICTKDLICWSWQVARGMEYLSGRKILHGDLAARNILLADDDVVKICDFGLAKSMYKDNNYQKKGDGPVPVKWMPIEAIRDGIFSTQSDVWSFGIVMWEFFTLARTPYHDMDMKKQCESVANGYRLEQPRYAPKEIYKIMTSCWNHFPLQRPSFSTLATNIGNLTDDFDRSRLVNLNTPYMEQNSKTVENGQRDYLMMSSAPDYTVFSSSDNEQRDMPRFSIPESSLSLRYVPMTPTSVAGTSRIVSPSGVSSEVNFDFSPSVANFESQSPIDNDGTEPSRIRRRSQCDSGYYNFKNSHLMKINEEPTSLEQMASEDPSATNTRRDERGSENPDPEMNRVTSCSNPAYVIVGLNNAVAV